MITNMMEMSCMAVQNLFHVFFSFFFFLFLFNFAANQFQRILRLLFFPSWKTTHFVLVISKGIKGIGFAS